MKWFLMVLMTFEFAAAKPTYVVTIINSAGKKIEKINVVEPKKMYPINLTVKTYSCALMKDDPEFIAITCNSYISKSRELADMKYPLITHLIKCTSAEAASLSLTDLEKKETTSLQVECPKEEKK